LTPPRCELEQLLPTIVDPRRQLATAFAQVAPVATEGAPL
jgi:hypothetical protein